MLNLAQLNDLFNRLGTPPAGRNLILKARNEAPVREVRSTGGNVVHFYPSRKMCRVIKTESGSPEFRAAIHHEFDSDVLEYFPQPLELTVRFHDDDPKHRTQTIHTPDFLVIRRTGLVIEEWKTESRLRKLAANNPSRYRIEAGYWRNPAVEELLLDRGIQYQLRSDRDHPTIYIENLRFLAQYFDESCPPPAEAAIAEFRAMLRDRPIIPLWEMLNAASAIGDQGVDSLYKAIADRQISFDLNNEALGDTLRANVFRDEAAISFYRVHEAEPVVEGLATQIQEGASVNYDGKIYTIQMVGQHEAILKGDGGFHTFPIKTLERFHLEGVLTVRAVPRLGLELAERMNALPPHILEVAASRADLLERAKACPMAVDKSPRTLARYRKAMRDAGDSLVDQRFALAPRWMDCGPRDSKISKEVLQAIEDTMREFYNKEKNPTKAAAYLFFVEKCAALGLLKCSLNTFLLKMRPLVSDQKRLGKKGAYQKQPIIYYLAWDTPIHGVRPWEIVHIDGTELELFACGFRSRRKLGKIWLTKAIDAASRAMLGFYISFSKAGYRSIMMVIRDMVRRHKRLPEIIVLDNGPEHKAQALAQLCRLYGITIRWRPKGEPRFGTVIERSFGTTMTQFVHLLDGNTQLLRNPRSVSKSVQPDQFVRWNLLDLHKAMEWYFFEAYGCNAHPALAGMDWETPVEYLERRMDETGHRRHCLVRYDEQFLIETCPGPTRGSTRIVDSQRGIFVNNYWYQSGKFNSVDMHGKQVEVRVDPWDDGYVFALVNNHWERCVSKAATLHRSFTSLERRYATQWIRSRTKQRWQDDQEKLAAWKAIVDPAVKNPDLAEQEADAKALYTSLGMGPVVGNPYGPASAPTPGRPTKTLHRAHPKGTLSMAVNQDPSPACLEEVATDNPSQESFHVLPLL